jgi:hypothetical protein
MNRKGKPCGQSPEEVAEFERKKFEVERMVLEALKDDAGKVTVTLVLVNKASIGVELKGPPDLVAKARLAIGEP